MCLLYDSTKAVKRGSTAPIKLKVCDSSGNDLSSTAINVHAISVIKVLKNLRLSTFFTSEQWRSELKYCQTWAICAGGAAWDIFVQVEAFTLTEDAQTVGQRRDNYPRQVQAHPLTMREPRDYGSRESFLAPQVGLAPNNPWVNRARALLLKMKGLMPC